MKNVYNLKSVTGGNLVQRREFTTQGADPTVVVEYTIRATPGHDGVVDGTFLTIKEFQNIFITRMHRPDGTSEEFPENIGKILFDSLEELYQKEQNFSVQERS